MLPKPTIAVLGASGLIGQFVAETLLRDGFPVVAVARRFTPAQQAVFGDGALRSPIASLSDGSLADLLAACGVDIVLNCIGVLQDGPRGSTAAVHQTFVTRLLRAIAVQTRPTLLIQVSIPGREVDDATGFSRTKRSAEHAIAHAATPFVILRPGFVVAPSAYGGSALIRSLAVLPFELPATVAAAAFQPVAVEDIARTVAVVARRWQLGERTWAASWDLMVRQPATVGEVVAGFRRRLGGAPALLRIPTWMLGIGARLGDAAAWLGWLSPIRSTALQEMMRGVTGDPDPWIEATGIEPADLPAILGSLPGSVQERWFARLYLLKAGVIATLALFWIVSGGIALQVGFRSATGILSAHGVLPAVAGWITGITSLLDIAIGVAIAAKPSCRAGLLGGVAVSVLYLLSATLLTPELWADPLGPLVKIAPSVVLMAVALAILPDR